METLIAWVVKSTIASGILYAYYQLFLRNKKFHSYNRFYLLAAVTISLAMPFIHFSWYNIQAAQNISLNNLLTVISASDIRQQSVFHFTAGMLMVAGSAVVSIFLFALLLSRIIWIYRIKRKDKAVKMQDFNLIETCVKQAPFSFLDNLFWKKGMSVTDGNGQKIFMHELTHIRQRHTYDKLFTQIVVCTCWINPFFWLMQRELNIIHEFIADAKSIREGDAESFALMLLQSHNEGRYLSPVNSFFHSPLKRRLIMITNPNKTQYSYLRRALVLPVILPVVAVFSVTVGRAQTDPKANPGPVKISSVNVEKKPAGNNADDSTADVRIGYFKPDGSTAILHLANVKYKSGVHDPSEEKPHIKLEDGTEQDYTVDEVKRWVEFIIQNPPDVIYYLNGKETSKEHIKKLDASNVKTANVIRGQEAITKYGDKAGTGVILFTTE